MNVLISLPWLVVALYLLRRVWLWSWRDLAESRGETRPDYVTRRSEWS
jgi:hypothetical protein